MTDDHHDDEDDGGTPWPRGLGEDVRSWGDPADPTLPPPDPTGEREKEAARLLANKLPTYNSPELRPIQFAEAYARLVAVAVARSEFYGELLAQQYAREGIGGLIGHEYNADRFGTLYQKSEAARGLVELEAAERERAAKLIRDGVRLGIEAKQVDVMRTYGRTVVVALQGLVAELGLDWNEDTRRASMRAILAARTQLGQQIIDPGQAGPPLTEEQRQRLLGGADGG